MSEYAVIGKSIPRIDALKKVTGEAIYSGDVILPRMLHGKVLRSPYPHALIKRLDVAKARALDGVKAVITAADVPGFKDKSELSYPEAPHLARDKVVYAGQPIAAVAATSLRIAEEAIGVIEVEYEELPPLLDTAEAMKPDAPLIYPDLYTNRFGRGPAAKDNTPSNIPWHVIFERGHPEAGFKEADLVLENTYHTQIVHQGYLEPMAAVADVDGDGKITVWTQNQGLFTARGTMAEFLDLPLNRIKVMPVEIGGAFGGKTYQLLSPLCVLLSMKTGCPVRMEMTRDEVLAASRPAPAASITVKMGATRQGLITAISLSMIFDEGGFPERPYSINAATTGIGLYRIPNLRLEVMDVLTNKVPAGSYRAPAAPPAAFAIESQLDLISRSLGIDPLQLRLLNVASEGDLLPNGTPLPRVGFKETLVKMADTLNERGKSRNRGIACGFWRGAAGTFAASLYVNGDGTVSLATGVADVSGSRTGVAQMVAEEMGLPIEAVTIATGDTDTAPYADMSTGSRTAYSLGIAVVEACRDAKAQLIRRAAKHLEKDEGEIEYSSGLFRVKGSPDKSVTLAKVARSSLFSPGGGPIVGKGSVGVPPFAPMIAVHAAEVDVDRETGKVKVLSYIAAQDVGKAINPMLVEGQIQGAVTQGIGWALMEDYIFDKGVMQNATLLDYRMPTAADVPMVETVLVEVGSTAGPYGMRAVGEPPMVPVMAAIANAIHSATGVRIKDLPMTPEVILKALKAL
jgi:xanthine dehydrogenase molybdenum-binding subunit